MKQLQHYVFLTLLITTTINKSFPPLGMFVPYDINIKQKKTATKTFQWINLFEKSYNAYGYATDTKEEETFLVNPLQIYEPSQNIIGLYQGYNANGTTIQTLTTPFTQLLDSIAGGPGGGVNNFENGFYKPTAKISSAQLSCGITYGLGRGFFISTYLPFYFAQLSHLNWTYVGNNFLFSDEKIQTELIDTFIKDTEKYFNLNIRNWKQKGIGDLTLLAEWQRDFPQRKQILKNVQANLRVGLSFPTGYKPCENVIMPIPFGADGAIGLPFGGGLGITLSTIAEFGFSGQFWYFWSNEKIRRIKTFPTQTTLLMPTLTNTYKEYAILQNFNLHAQLYSFCKRLTLKTVYQYWRKGKDTLIPLNSIFDFNVVNSAKSLDEVTRHQITVLTAYSPLKGDFNKIIPQFEIFWKGSINGTRAIIASTYGIQFSLIF